MKLINFLFIPIFLVFITSCSDSNSLCHQEQGIQALEASLIESVVNQSDFLAREYGLTDVEAQLKKLFNENKIQVTNIDLMNTTVIDSKLVCSCSTELSFADDSMFLKAIAPRVTEAKSSGDKYSKIYLKNKHLIKYSDKGHYSFFYSVFKTDDNLSASVNDYKVGSLLIDYLATKKP